MRVRFLSQGLGNGRDRAIGNELELAIPDAKFDSLLVLVAFVRTSAASFLCELIKKRRVFRAELFVGIDQKGTSKEALQLLLASSARTNIFYSVSRPIYHPKIYVFSGPSDVRIVVGSSNLTESGLFLNFESSVRIDFAKGDAEGEALLGELKEFLQAIEQSGNLRKLTKVLIRTLDAAGLLPSETESAAIENEDKTTTAKAGVARLTKLFPPRRTPSLRRLRRTALTTATRTRTTSHPAGTSPPPPNNTMRAAKRGQRHFWIETGSLTGGSRNQLDLSMVSSFQRIGGSLSLFGVDGAEKRKTRSIRLRFAGRDYVGNRILFPLTAKGKTNGTWRLQMNGRDQQGDSLSVLCKTNRFLDKVMVFREIRSDHYEIDAFAVKNSLRKLKKSSKVWDRNRGRNGKHYGIL